MIPNQDSQLAAVLWDLDGTLVDTEPLWMNAERELAATYGKEWSEADGLQLVGFDLLDAGAHIQSQLGIELSAAAIVEFLVARVSGALHSAKVNWRPGVRDLIAALRAEGIPQAIVTMSYAPIAEPIARQLPIDALITGDMVSNGVWRLRIRAMARTRLMRPVVLCSRFPTWWRSPMHQTGRSSPVWLA